MVADNSRAARSTPARRAGAQSRQSRPIRGMKYLPYLFIAPAVVYLLAFLGVPLLQELRLSLSNTQLLKPSEFTFIGLDNYRGIMADPGFVRTLVITGVYTVACVTGIVAMGLAVALLMDRSFKGRGIVRSLVIIPWAAPSVAVALVSTWMVNGQYGIVNRALDVVGLKPPGGVWLDSSTLALPTVVTITVWQLFPFTAVVILAALQAVSQDVREAALLDGAGPIMQFRAVVWPVIAPTVGLMALLVTIWSIRRFELIWLMTQGGPAGATNTLVIDLYRRGFVNYQLGQSAAVGIVGLVISTIITVAYVAVNNRQARV